MAKGLFATTASGEAFEGGDSDNGQEAHDADNGEEFDEGEGRRGAARMLQFLIFDFEFWIGRGDGRMRNPGKNAGRGRGDKVDHVTVYTAKIYIVNTSLKCKYCNVKYYI